MSFTIQQIEQYAASKRFREGLAIPSGKSIEFSMLGQGEYNINYLFTHPVNGQKLVLRINTGSQMHLPDQIGYEYYALKLLENSTRTPKPYYLDSENHLLVMEYLPGRALDYRTDLKLAAECLAQIHSVSVLENCHLLCPDDPLDAMLNECQQMAEVYLRSDKSEKKTKEMLYRLLDAAKKHGKKEQQMSRCIINTELNSGNFLINPAYNFRPRLVSTSPFTDTRPSWITSLASTPDSTRPAALTACPSLINSSCSLNLIVSIIFPFIQNLSDYCSSSKHSS